MNRTITAILATAALVAAIALITLPQLASAEVETQERDTFQAVNDVQSPVKVDVAPYAAHLLEIAHDKAVAVAAESEPEPIWDGVYTYEAPTYQNGSGLTREGGVNYHDGRLETWYSSNVLYHYRTGEWTVDAEGFYRDDQGRYIVAASDMPQGTVFQGSKGDCIVADSGCAAGTTDYYTNF